MSLSLDFRILALDIFSTGFSFYHPIQETQKFILNTQDAGRYMAPMLQIMANISLPKTFSMFEEIDVSDEGLDRFRSRKRPVPGTAPVRVQPVVHIINRENHETGQISGQNCGFKKIL